MAMHISPKKKAQKLSFFTSDCSLIPSTSTNNESLNCFKSAKMPLSTKQSFAFIPTKTSLNKDRQKMNLKEKKVPIYKQKTNDELLIKKEKVNALNKSNNRSSKFFIYVFIL